MFATTPRLEIYPDRLAHNAGVLMAQCADHGIKVAAVTKVLAAHFGLLEGLAQAGVTMVADSRLDNLRRVAEFGLNVPTLLLRAPGRGDIYDTLRWADYSLESSVDTVRQLSEAAGVLGVSHKVLLMVDLGDLREGQWPDQVVDTAVAMSRLPHIELAGLGTNLACYGGVLPSVANMSQLVDLRDQCRVATNLPLDIISGGNSANLPLLASGQMPGEINLLRLGESICLGRNVLDRTPWPGTRQDTVRLVAEIIETERKPSVPIGQTGQDAFGNYPQFEDRGVRRRAICNVGRQDINAPDTLTPEDPGITVIGGSSDHLIIDITDAQTPVGLGSEIGFWPSYGGLTALSVSSFVRKYVVRGD